MIFKQIPLAIIKRSIFFPNNYSQHIQTTKLLLLISLCKNVVQILLAYMTTPRREGPEVNKEMAENDAVVLYKAGEKRLGMDEKTFVRIISERSAAQLAAINQFYRSKYGHSLKKVFYPKHSLCLYQGIFWCLSMLNSYQAIKKETSGSFGRALFTIVQCANNPAKYFAKVFPWTLILGHLFL